MIRTVVYPKRLEQLKVNWPNVVLVGAIVAIALFGIFFTGGKHSAPKAAPSSCSSTFAAVVAYGNANQTPVAPTQSFHCTPNVGLVIGTEFVTVKECLYVSYAHKQGLNKVAAEQVVPMGYCR